MEFTGYASVEMNKGYTHLELDPLRAVTSTITSVMEKKAE